jgi:hydroxypyruvate isomerase
VYRNNLTWAAKEAEKIGVSILIEPINARDMPGYFLSRQDEAHDLVAQVGAANLKVQMDLYHCQIVEGDVTMQLRRYLGGSNNPVGHLQIAGVPERHEPDEGELHYEYLFQTLEDLGYDGWIGCEYRPRAGTSEGLSWLQKYRSLQR